MTSSTDGQKTLEMSANTSAKNHVGTERRELEWQLTAEDLGAVRRWLADHHTIDDLTIEPRSPVQIDDTYFDTCDRRIQRAGFALRVRKAAGESEATLKELRSANEKVADRRELTEPLLTDAGPDAISRSAGPVGTRVHAVVGAHSLETLFAVRTARQRFAVRRQDGVADLGEISLDETVISRPDGDPQAGMQRVEVEAMSGEREPLEELVKTLSRECVLESTMESKYAFGLKSVGLATPSAPDFGVDCVDASMAVDEAALATLRRLLSQWIAHEPGARLGDDAAELHDLRVLGRRIDAVLGLFAAYLPAVLRRKRPRLKMVLDALGSVRDIDIQLAHLEAFRRDLAVSDRAAIDSLKSLLDAERTKARARMLRVMDSPRTEEWMGRLKADLLKPAASRLRHDHGPITIAAPRLIESRYKKLRKAARRLTVDSSMEDYHAVRRRIKRLRYAVEPVAAIYGRPADKLLQLLRRLQDELGEQQDAHVTVTRLHALTRQRNVALPAETVFLIGRLAERHAAAGVRGRDDFESNYPKLRKRWKRLYRKLDRLNVHAQDSAPDEPTASASGPALSQAEQTATQTSADSEPAPADHPMTSPSEVRSRTAE
jgi:CHAD domain-containing protein